jgi:hypothetical protein
LLVCWVVTAAILPARGKQHKKRDSLDVKWCTDKTFLSELSFTWAGRGDNLPKLLLLHLCLMLLQEHPLLLLLLL